MKSYKFLKHHIVFEYLDSDSTLSLNPLVIGYERCESTKGVIGPLTRTRYVFQYVFKGKGTLTVANKTYKIGKDTLFFLPVENVSYAPNKSDPVGISVDRIYGLAREQSFENRKAVRTESHFSSQRPR